MANGHRAQFYSVLRGEIYWLFLHHVERQRENGYSWFRQLRFPSKTHYPIYSPTDNPTFELPSSIWLQCTLLFIYITIIILYYYTSDCLREVLTLRLSSASSIGTTGPASLTMCVLWKHSLVRAYIREHAWKTYCTAHGSMVSMGSPQ